MFRIVKCNLFADGTALELSGMQIAEFKMIGNLNGLQYLYLTANQITAFNPTIALPISLFYLELSGNQITAFNLKKLPDNLQYLLLGGNQLITFDYTKQFPTNLLYLDISYNQITYFNPTTALPIGLKYLYLSGNQLTLLNPSIPFPVSLRHLEISNNQFTNAGYSASEPWANAMTYIANRGAIISFNNSNTNSINGTSLKSILMSKGWTILSN